MALRPISITLTGIADARAVIRGRFSILDNDYLGAMDARQLKRLY
jgi:hypothetical protein